MSDASAGTRDETVAVGTTVTTAVTDDHVGTDVRRRGPNGVRNGNALPPGRRRVRRNARQNHRYASGWSVPERKMRLGKPLRFATIPLEYESLVGLIARATADHVLLNLNRVIRRAGISMDRPGYLPRLDRGTLAGLAPVLGCTVEQVTDLAMTVLAPEASSSGVIQGASTLRAQDVEAERRRISPLAIAQGSHHRNVWLLRILPYCPVSYELLRSDCSECGSPLRWKKSVGIGVCETCEMVVAPTSAPLLESKYRDDYALFARLLSNHPVIRGRAVAELSPAVRHVDGDTLIPLIIGLGACTHLEKRYVKRNAIYRLPPATLAAIISTGTGMLREWPGRLQNWAREEAAKLAVGGPAFQTLRANLQRLGHRASVTATQATLIREALPDIFLDERRSFRPLGETVLHREASAILGISGRLSEMIEAGLIEAEETGTGKHRQFRFTRRVIDGLRSRMDDSISMPLFSRTTGLPIYAVENLCDHAILDRVNDAALHYLRHTASLKRRSVERLRSDIFNRERSPHPDDAIALGTAVRRIGGRLKPWTSILAALRDGSLPLWIDPNATPDTRWLRSIFVRPSELIRFDEVEIAGASERGYLPPENCSLTDAKDILNLHGTLSIDLQDVFSDAIAACEQRGPKKSVSMDAVLRIARTEISIAEICARAEWNPRQVKWALRPFEGVRTPCGWDRATIESSGVIAERIEWTVPAHRRGPRTNGSR